MEKMITPSLPRSSKNALEDSSQSLYKVIQILLDENKCLSAKVHSLESHTKEDTQSTDMLHFHAVSSTRCNHQLLVSEPKQNECYMQNERNVRQGHYLKDDRIKVNEWQLEKKRYKICKFCNRRHRWGTSFCQAYGYRCKNCVKNNHFTNACWFSTKKLKVSKSLPSKDCSSRNQVDEQLNSCLP